MNQKLLRKKFLGFLIAVAFYLGAAERVHGQWVPIPDANFANAIDSITGYSGAISGNYMDTTNLDIVDYINYLDVSNLSINDLEGIEYFKSLISLNCKFNYLSSLPNLPSTLTTLDCSINHLVKLPSLPPFLSDFECWDNYLDSLPSLPLSLVTLNCQSNNIASLPILPPSLKFLECALNFLDTLPLLPSSLYDLICSSNRLTLLPMLPSSLRTLWCENNLLTALPTLPDSLSELSCDYNYLTSLPILPSVLTQLTCSYDPLDSFPSHLPDSLVNLRCDGISLTVLPPLPSTLWQLTCSDNSLSILPSSLPDSLAVLFCYGNLLTSLPSLPSTLYALNCSNNFISCLPLLPENLKYLADTNNLNTCLPNIPQALISVYGPDSLCTPNNSPCSIYPRITGVVYDDDNLNATLDSTEIGHPNLTIQIQPGNYFFPTGDSTYYSYVVDTGAAYTITANAIPYYNIVPASHSTPVLSYAMIDSLNDFALQRKGIVHDLSVRITPNEVAWRGADMTHTLTATNNGTVRDTASLQYIFDSQLTYVSSSPPAVVNGDTLQWNNINLVPGQKTNAQVAFHINSFIPLGTKLYSNALINPIATDTTPADNVDSLTQVVVGSYDPNEKTVEPQGAITIADVTKGLWLDYIVRFQNTGTAAALKVEIQDTLSSNLDLNTIQIITSSHKMTWSVRHSIAYFEFDAINLPDSGADETASHGFVRYRIKAKTTLSAGDFINNTAYIYFDSNSPVVTNTTNTVVSFPTKINAFSDDFEVQLYPNPASNELTLQMSSFTKDRHIKLFIRNIFGQTVIQSAITGSKSEVDISTLAAGIYLVEIIGEKERVLRKFVKE